MPLRRLALIVAVLSLSGCELGYYTQLARGQYDLLSRREPIDQVLARPDLDPTLRQRLTRAVDARRYASAVLLLPDNGSYKKYADLQRSAALYNVFAAPEFSLEPHEWCHWFVGCLAYRGYYRLDSARDEADTLRRQGLDVFVSPVPAYSTLGWFDDPLLNTVTFSDEAVVSTIFHELAHQKRFVKGDTPFNESFATFVEEEGLRQYFRSEPDVLAAAARRQQRLSDFVELMLKTRDRLAAIYRSGAAPHDMRRLKAETFDVMQRDYVMLKKLWGGDFGYDIWMTADFNNARLLPFGLYHQWVPAFAALYKQANGDWGAFYREVDAVAALDANERKQRLERLAKSGPEPAPRPG